MMKKQTIIAVGAVVAVVLVIVALFVKLPSVSRDNIAGTFVKAEKYHKTQMTQKDIQLRSQLTSDSVKLKSTLQGLAYFAVFTEDLCLKIDTSLIVFQEQGMKSGDAGYSQLMILKDYAVFIRNNNQTLGKTISMLSSFYLSDQPDQSADVEKNMREFSDYVKLFAEKDDILESALKGMDSYILGNKILLERKDELKKLKSIRDQILISGVQLAGMFQDKALCSNLILLATNSLSQNANLAQGNLGNASLVNSKGDLGNVTLVNSKGELGNASLVNSNGELQAGLVYDKENLQFGAVNGLQFASLSNAGNYSISRVIGVACWGAQEGLQVFIMGFDMEQAIKGHPIFSQDGLQSSLAEQLGSGFVLTAGDAMNASSALNIYATSSSQTAW